METIQNIITNLQLQPHPEGGYFRETYRSSGEISRDNLGTEYSGNRRYSTSIYYLLTSDTFSAFHRILQDEIWHFYEGSPLNLHMISPQGVYSKAVIGCNMLQGQVPQYIVPARTWFAASVIDNNTFSLLGCTVAPGFDFNDFELGEREKLMKMFPAHSELILQMTR
jgi:predicted cupin superfamily sugar epimerase